MKTPLSSYDEKLAFAHNGYLDHNDRPREVFEGEFDFFRNLAHVHGGPILELASGAGRIAVVLAEEGFDVYGVESSVHMLKIANRARDRLPQDVRNRLHYQQGDMRSFAFNKTFPLIIIPYDSFWFNFSRAFSADEESSRLKVIDDSRKTESIILRMKSAQMRFQAESCLISILAALKTGGVFVIDHAEGRSFTQEYVEGKEQWWRDTAERHGFSYKLVKDHGSPGFGNVLIGHVK